MIDFENHIVQSFNKKYENISDDEMKIIDDCANKIADLIIETFNPQSVTKFMFEHENLGCFIEFTIPKRLGEKKFFIVCDGLNERIKEIENIYCVSIHKHHNRYGTIYNKRNTASCGCGVILGKNKSSGLSYNIELNNIGLIYGIQDSNTNFNEYVCKPGTHIRIYVEYSKYGSWFKNVIYMLINKLVLFKALKDNVENKLNTL